ncbi:hypothetical protein J6590_072152 [Homalodisca vitripennis]|nr:hypothetical protein J6590_072152 [Homalodisca vitripennis]
MLKDVSSAKRHKLPIFTAVGISFTNKRKSIGPRTKPCGTPVKVDNSFDSSDRQNPDETEKPGRQKESSTDCLKKCSDKHKISGVISSTKTSICSIFEKIPCTF